MDNITHTLTSIAISQTGLNQKTRFATLTLILAGNAPDLDVLWGFKGSIAYLQHHRGISHSLLGITAIALLLWALIYGVGKRARPKPGLPLNGWWLALAAFLGTGSHLLLDYTNAYGVRPFLPFSGRWYAWDIMPIFDPILLALLVLGLAVPWLLRMISEEVGARQPRMAPGAVFCLCGLVAIWGVRDFAHRRALTILDSHTYSGEDPQRFSALPSVLNPLVWTGIVETEASFHIVRVNARDPNSIPEQLGILEKPQPSAALSAAMRAPQTQVFLDFARFPWAQVEDSEGGYVVRLSDLRFFRPSAQSQGFVLVVELNEKLQTSSAQFFFSAPERRD